MTFAFIIDSVFFDQPTRDGFTSLGGSESACLGLSRALVARGHDVSIFTTKMDPALHGTSDPWGVAWYDYSTFEATNQYLEYDVCCALRVFAAFGRKPINARLRLLWNQDLLVPGDMQAQIMAISWALDKIVYVSDYHRAQWEQLQPELKNLSYVTRNGIDPAQVPATSTKNPNRIIHISRPERGLAPLLAMWPALRAAKPDAELHICRYSSMYDTGAGSWSEVCQSYDDAIADLNQTVGGITYLGELNKPQLYQAISDAAVMWYPGVSSFAETSCIAAIEAQACGTPFVGSYRGALPETIPSGVLIHGDHESPAYRTASVNAVLDLLDGCRDHSFQYRQLVKQGKAHVASYDYDTIAAEWDTQINLWFEERYAANKLGVLRQLLHEDEHVWGGQVARSMIGADIEAPPDEVFDAKYLCACVIAGLEHTAEDYGNFAIADVLFEARSVSRYQTAAAIFEGRSNILDVACGNGSCPIALAWKHPDIKVHGLDFSPINIARAKQAAIDAGVADRVTFDLITIYDFDTQLLAPEMTDWLEAHAGQFDGLFVGEFIEHTAGYQDVIDGLETALQTGAQVLYTCPAGAFQEIADLDKPLRRSHVHRFYYDDVLSVWGPKLDVKGVYLKVGTTPRGKDIGHWAISYKTAPGRPAGTRNEARLRRTRPMPKLTVGIIAKDASNDLGRCLVSVRNIADEIIVADTGSRDRTMELAKEYGATVFSTDGVHDQAEGFAGARNEVLKRATGDWFLWIDADEQLINSVWLRSYLDSGVFHGFVIRQTHLYVDGSPTFDRPIRVFRTNKGIQFYGCVHEQPQMGDCNADVYPALDVTDIVVAHWGYLTPGGREEKRVKRNLPLLIKDQHVFPDRMLGKVLCVREAVLQADAMREAARGEMTDGAREGYQFAIGMHTKYFDDPSSQYHKLSRPWYEQALKHLEMGFEAEIAQACRIGGLEGRHAKPERVWVRDADEYERIMTYRTKGLADQLRSPTFLTDPDLLKANEPVGVRA